MEFTTFYDKLAYLALVSSVSKSSNIFINSFMLFLMDVRCDKFSTVSTLDLIVIARSEAPITAGIHAGRG
jgi:hypothetical protein